MKRTTILATVAIAAVLGSVIATLSVVAQQAQASQCHILDDKVNCSNENSFRSQAFNYLGKDDSIQLYQYKEHPNGETTERLK